MALYNVLDQAAILEHFLIAIIEYFEWQSQGIEIPETHLGNFMQVVNLVEEWSLKSDAERSTKDLIDYYHDNFEEKLKHAM